MADAAIDLGVSKRSVAAGMPAVGQSTGLRTLRMGKADRGGSSYVCSGSDRSNAAGTACPASATEPCKPVRDLFHLLRAIEDFDGAVIQSLGSLGRCGDTDDAEFAKFR